MTCQFDLFWTSFSFIVLGSESIWISAVVLKEKNTINERHGAVADAEL